jgi:Flp pilus assembly protein TadD
VKDLTLAVAGSPDDAYRRYLLGLALWKSGDLPGAEDALVESVKRDGSRLKTWVNLARVRNERGDRTGALEAAEKGLDLDPTSADVLHQKGRALMELGRGPEALDALQTAHDLDVDNGYIANSLGLLLIQLGRPGDAVPTLEIAKTRLPTWPTCATTWASLTSAPERRTKPRSNTRPRWKPATWAAKP